MEDSPDRRRASQGDLNRWHEKQKAEGERWDSNLFFSVLAMYDNLLMKMLALAFLLVYIVSVFKKRLQKELLAFQNDPPPGMTLDEKSVQNSITQWIVDMEGAPGTLYEGEKFQLLFKFSSRYPFDSPQVMFTGDNIPVHPHVYSNGHICLSILTEDWSPALSVQSVCLSIISMLSSCKEKRRPPDNSFYVRTCNKNPKKTKWWYHGKWLSKC
ncbi:Ubiquitin-conjugating enzyme E2 W [Willisornis vidua]|uniref:Ubiquitin-conjugating enzyme E2 W n=1 Tax=Willisornis vidua TaxID=1566151 RepID=A0ABQ9CS09_9PASS|nr:Ubiquitin-conjugating enzyme E2 W [Willisornis vidua]